MHKPISTLPPILLVLGLFAGPMAAVERTAVAEHYAELVHASYQDSLIEARALRATLERFLAEPDAAGLRAAKAAWLQAREPYGQTEAYRFYGGPIDDEDGLEALINAWPLDENYIDYTVDGIGGGIIADREAHPEITPEVLRKLNEWGGDANISTGYHAIEFLLWGQDLNRDDPLSAGQRPVTDYRDAEHAARRAAYLRTVADLLIADLAAVTTEWRPDAENYRADFVADPDRALGRIIVGLGSLSGGELAGERMAVALENKDQEDEHSCFSDNTHRDIALNQQGIVNVWTGTYRRIDGTVLRGPGLRAAVAATDPDLATRIDAALATASQRIAAIRAPFDRELVTEDGRARIQSAIEALWVQTRLLPEAAAALGVEASIEGL